MLIFTEHLLGNKYCGDGFGYIVLPTVPYCTQGFAYSWCSENVNNCKDNDHYQGHTKSQPAQPEVLLSPKPVQTHSRPLSCFPLPSLLWSCHMVESFCSVGKRTRFSFREIWVDASLWFGLGLLGALNKLRLASRLWFPHLWKAFKVRPPPHPSPLIC